MIQASATPRDVAAWMLLELERQGYLDQGVAVVEIMKRFGDKFTKYNAIGNLVIHESVLGAFRKLTGNDVVWVRTERHWRRREEYDEPGRTQS